MVAAVVPLVYYFPFLWKTNTICQENLVVDDTKLEKISLDNLVIRSSNRIFCEQDCPVSNFNGFLNFAQPGDCQESLTTMRYFCDCNSNVVKPCVGR